MTPNILVLNTLIAALDKVQLNSVSPLALVTTGQELKRSLFRVLPVMFIIGTVSGLLRLCSVKSRPGPGSSIFIVGYFACSLTDCRCSLFGSELGTIWYMVFQKALQAALPHF